MRLRLIAWFVIGWILLVMLSWFKLAAQTIDMQNRDTIHLQADVSHGCFASLWLVENARTVAANNNNVWFGGGCGSSRHWLEVQAQKQFNQTGGFWAVDQRYFQQFGQRWSLAVETTEIVSKPGFYEYAVVERKLSPRFSLRVETENTHRLTKQIMAAGGGVTIRLMDRCGWKVSSSAVYRASPTGPDELRFYLGVSKRFTKRGQQ